MIMLDRKYAKLAADKAIELLNIDSPSGFTENIADKVIDDFTKLGYVCQKSNKGNVLVEVSSPLDSSPGFESPSSSPDKDVILFEAHGDTLGAMVKQIKSNGRLLVSPLGGLVASNVETENVRVYTRDNKVYEGTFQLANASSHVNRELNTKERTFDTVEIVLDERVNSKEDVKNLGISVGDFVCVEARAHITSTGYIKSRFLDDKLSVATLYAYASYLKENNIKLDKKVYFLITVYEEVGHGGSYIPSDVTEAISVDMGCVGDGLECSETQVSICAKDSGGLMLDDEIFMKSLGNTFFYAVVTGPAGYILSFVIAWLITENSKGMRSFLTLVFYAPSLAGNVYMIWSYLFSGDSYGLINSVLLRLGIISNPIQWLTDPSYNSIAVIVVVLWTSMGAGFLSFVAGFQQLNKELFEAGAIDGIKNRWQELWHITLPQMVPQLLTGAVLSISGAFSIGYQNAQLTGNPSTDYSTHTVLLHMLDFGYTRFEMGYASTVAVILFAIMILSWLIINRTLRSLSSE